MNVRRTWVIALAALAGGSVTVALGLLGGVRSDTAAWAAPLRESAADPNVAVSATPLGQEKALICLLDTHRDRLMVYLADGKRGRLRLLAVRDISADWALTDYNNERPYPKDIRQRVEKWKESTGGGRAGTGKPQG